MIIEQQCYAQVIPTKDRLEGSFFFFFFLTLSLCNVYNFSMLQASKPSRISASRCTSAVEQLLECFKFVTVSWPNNRYISQFQSLLLCTALTQRLTLSSLLFLRRALTPAYQKKKRQTPTMSTPRTAKLLARTVSRDFTSQRN